MCSSWRLSRAPSAGVARAKADELRDEFAQTLGRLGDRYWEYPGGRPFAIDYYAQALIFDPSHAVARERAALTIGQLATLRWKAEHMQFSDAELIAVEPLTALAEEDESVRAEKLDALRNRDGERSASTDAHLDRLMSRSRSDSTPRKKSSRSRRADPLPPVQPAEQPAVTKEQAPSKVPAPKHDDDPKRAKQLASRADSLLHQGERTAAERLYHQALAHDRRSLRALSGLGDLYFDKADYSRSLHFRELAVKRAPRSAQARIALGDAYFKVLRYRDAQREYARARSMGSKGAEGRLAKVRAKLGE